MKFICAGLSILIILFIARLVNQNITIPSYLGHESGHLAPMPNKPNAVSSQTTIEAKKVASLPYKGSGEETMNAVMNTLQQMGHNTLQLEEKNYIYTVFTSPLLHFNDDVEILLVPSEQRVHFRSQSRSGYADFGVNRTRYEAFQMIYLKIK